MYLVGGAHPHKADAQLLLERSSAAGEYLVTDAEVLREIVHRYAALNRREVIGPAIDILLGFADEVFPIDTELVLRASRIILGPESLSARDALHVAVMERHRIHQIMSFDSDFDRWPGITRLSSFDA